MSHWWAQTSWCSPAHGQGAQAPAWAKRIEICRSNLFAPCWPMGEFFFPQEELTGIKNDINKPNGDCLASPCRLAPFQPRLLLNYPENRRKEPGMAAFSAAFVSDLCQSLLKQESGSGTPPSSCNVLCGDIPADPTVQNQMSAADLAHGPRGWLPWAMALPELWPQGHKGDKLVQIGVKHIGRLKFRFLFRGAAKGLSSSRTQRAVCVSAGGSCSGQGQGIGVPSPRLGRCSLCKMIWGQKSSLEVMGLFNEQLQWAHRGGGTWKGSLGTAGALRVLLPFDTVFKKFMGVMTVRLPLIFYIFFFFIHP